MLKVITGTRFSKIKKYSTRNKGAQNDYRRSIKKLTHAKPVPSSSGRKVRTRSGLYVEQPKMENYYGMEHEWKDKRKFKE